jgi:hypothetical protein
MNGDICTPGFFFRAPGLTFLWRACLVATLFAALTLPAAAQNGTTSGKHEQAVLELRVHVVPVALSSSPGFKGDSIHAPVAYYIPPDTLQMSVTEEIRPLRAGEGGLLPADTKISIGILKTQTIVLR